jgi:hypothetical protein
MEYIEVRFIWDFRTICIMRIPPREKHSRRGRYRLFVEGQDPRAPKPGKLVSDKGTKGVVSFLPPNPVDPAGPDRYRGGAKPWESYAPGQGSVADG